MNEVISKMLSSLKGNRWSKMRIEKALNFANGTLGKAEKGLINLTPEKEKQFHEFYAKYGTFQSVSLEAAGVDTDPRYQQLLKENALLRSHLNAYAAKEEAYKKAFGSQEGMKEASKLLSDAMKKQAREGAGIAPINDSTGPTVNRVKPENPTMPKGLSLAQQIEWRANNP